MSYPEAIQFLYDLRLFGAKFGLENTFQLAALAANPQDRLRFIHVAGTNGKGSTCAMLESIYRAAGLRVGLFTSPHLVSFRERIQVNRRWIDQDDVVRLLAEIKPSFKHFPDGHQPTFFEVVTVMALKFFAEQRCDLVIWETGLGGRLDATNIVTPLASVITNIQMDHQQWLGDTLGKIAAEKAGIIKPGVPVLTATDEPEALGVIEKIVREKNAALTTVAADGNPPLNKFAALFRDAATLPLPGEHQKLNAALALAVVEVLQNQIPVTEERICLGLQTVDWPGRLQLITRESGQRLLLDGAHNVAGAMALRSALIKFFPFLAQQGQSHGGGVLKKAPPHPAPLPRFAAEREKTSADAAPTLILGVLQDKDWRHICETLSPLAARIFTVPVSSNRSANPEELAEVCRQTNPAGRVIACHSLDDALNRAAEEKFVVITGSLYLVGETLERLGLSPAGNEERGLNEWTTQPSAPLVG